MNALRLIFNNLRRGTVSFPLPHKHQCTSDQYRGLIENDAERCIGCAACAYVCPTAAIEVNRAGDTYTWAYDPGKCTFCSACLVRCKPNTLTMQSALPPLYNTQGALRKVLEMERKKPVRPPVPAVAKPATQDHTAAQSITSNPEPAAS